MSDSRSVIRDQGLRKLDLPDRGGDDEDADVVGERIRRDHEESIAVGTVVQRSSHDDLVVGQGDLYAASVLSLLGVGAFDVTWVPGEVANKEHTLQTGERNDDAFVTLRRQ